MKEMRFILTSDIHNCHQKWFASSNEERMEDYKKYLTQAQEKNKYDASFVLGDVSLDFWVCHEGGSYLQEVSVSNTDKFMKNIAPALPQPMYITPGNHEQYSHEDWMRFTGQTREQIIPFDGVVFVLCDAFSGNLGPDFHSDGTYLPINCDIIKKALADYPDAMIFLGAHYFDMEKESDEFKKLLLENDRIKGLFMGHDHRTKVEFTAEDAGCRPLLRTGNFSYSGEKDPLRAFRGWRELIIHEDGSFETYYFVPAQTFTHNGFTVSITENKTDYYRSEM